MTREESLKEMLRLRGVDDPCETCRGLGVHWYGNTSTWEHGVGGSSITIDVCDVCWGTGDKYRHGVDLRAQRDNLLAEIERRSLTMFVDRIGASMSVMHGTIEAMCVELDKLSRGRKQRPHFFYESCEQLAKMLRSAAAKEP
jgi:hypothetical protein